MTYRALKRAFHVDDAFLEDLKAELITAQRLAVDEQGAVLVWVGEPHAPGAGTAVSHAASPPGVREEPPRGHAHEAITY